MEVSRVEGKGGVKWVLAGEMDEDSVLRFESLVLNSHDKGSNVTIDMSGLTNIPNIGAKGFDHITTKIENSGSNLNIIGASGSVSRKLRTSGVITDQ